MVDRQQEVVVGGLVGALLGRQRRTVTARHYFLCDLGIHLSNHRVIRHETRPSVVNWAAITARAQHQTPIFHQEPCHIGDQQVWAAPRARSARACPPARPLEEDQEAEPSAGPISVESLLPPAPRFRVGLVAD